MCESELLLPMKEIEHSANGTMAITKYATLLFNIIQRRVTQSSYHNSKMSLPDL